MGIFSSVTGFNPYVAIAGIAAVVAVAGTIGYQNHQIHSYHTQYLTDEKTIAILQDRMAQATAEARLRQSNTTPVIKDVVEAPTPPVIKIIQSAPIPKDCTTPALDILRNNT